MRFFMLAVSLLLVSPALAQELGTCKGEIIPLVGVSKSLDNTDQFLRIDRDDQGQPTSLDTAVVRYKKEGVSVDLIGAVHVGEESYYQTLNDLFTKYDVLLYELVAEKGKVPGKKSSQQNPLGAMQGLMTKILGLQHQMSGVDYTKDNFVHADMSPIELQKRMTSRGESPMVYFLETMANSLREQNKRAQKEKPKKPEITEEELLLAMVQILLEKPSPVLKRYLATQFDDVDTQMKAFSGGLGQLIINDRNEACFDVLDEQLKAGKKKIGIFYGAAHLSHMDTLLTERGFVRGNTVWVEAWILQ